MSRKPMPMKPFHLYDFIPYAVERVLHTGVSLVPYTTYSKTVSGAMKTFADNHTGDFILVFDGVEKKVKICDGGVWYEEGSCDRACSGVPAMRTV